jgi:hypothetical protein
MRKVYPLVMLLCIFVGSSLAFGREARLVRYPSYANGRIAFTYLGDIWTADENGQNIQRLTVNKARDAYPRFSLWSIKSFRSRYKGANLPALDRTELP